MKVREIMTEDVKTVTPDTGVENVARLMKENDIGTVLVCEGSKTIGLITDRDIVIRAIAEGKNPSTVKAGEVMSTNLVEVTPDTDVHEAAEMMADYQIKRLPVVENGRLIGIVALGDLAIEEIHIDEAGNALSGISQGIQH
ncbi:MAG TPA: CBS domain-containing protein [Clostridia bacterium]|nr:CBS domain-containing protein [Clostridia bacterium]